MISIQMEDHKELNIFNSYKASNYFKIPLEFLRNNTIYTLSLSCSQVHGSIHYFSKFESVLIPDISPANAIFNISQKYLRQKGNIFDFKKNLISSQMNQQKILFPINSEEIRYISSARCDTNGNVLLIKFKSYNSVNQFIFTKNNILNIIYLTISAKINQNCLFKNLQFSIQIRKIIKSIQLYIEKNYENEKENSVIKDKEFLVPLSEQPNIAILIQTRNDITKTNFNSIVKKNFSIKEIYIALNISNLLNISSLSLNESNDINNYEDEDEDTVYSSNFSTQNHSTFSFNDISKNIKSYYNDNNYINYKRDHEIYNNSIYYTGFNHCYMDNNNKKYSSVSWDEMGIEVIIINSNDLFAKTLFNRFQDKSNTTCNFKILTDFLTINKKQFSNKMNINNFIKIFYEVSSVCLGVPIFKLNGELTKISLTPSLHSLKLYIKDKKLLSIFSKKYNKSENIEIKNFIINVMKEGIIKITYDEQRPYYLTESFYEKISELTDEIKYIKKITIDKIIIDKSYISLSWNIINTNNISSLKNSFNSYYSFNGDTLGIIPNLYEDNDLWVRNIEEISNKRGIINYRALICENNIEKVKRFISKEDSV